NERDHDDHRERHAVALELDELLDQHRPSPAPEAPTPEAAAPEAPEAGLTRRTPARHVRGSRRAHWKLSLALPMRSMKTSSSEGLERVQIRSARSRWGAIPASSAASSRPDTCRLVPNGATMSTPGRSLNSSASVASPSPLRALTVEVARCEPAITPSTVPCASSTP